VDRVFVCLLSGVEDCFGTMYPAQGIRLTSATRTRTPKHNKKVQFPRFLDIDLATSRRGLLCFAFVFRVLRSFRGSKRDCSPLLPTEVGTPVFDDLDSPLAVRSG
jgi:hypothetical protein